jgi:hypothetical protein
MLPAAGVLWVSILLATGCTDATNLAVPIQTEPYGQRSRYHVGTIASPEYWVRSPWDHYALEVQVRDAPGRPGIREQRARVRTFRPNGTGHGARGKVVYTDYQWYEASTRGEPVFAWDRNVEEVWLRAGSSTHDANLPTRAVGPLPDGRWGSRVASPGGPHTP